MRALMVLVLVALAVGPVVWRAQKDAGEVAGGKPKGPRPVAVEVGAVEQAPIRETVVLTGSLEARSAFTVASKVGGLVEDVGVEAGDPVEQGALVARLDDDEFVQARDQARAEVAVERARTNASRTGETYARRELERLQTLAARNLVSDTDLDGARGKLEAQRAQTSVNQALLSQKEAALRAAEVRLEYTQVHAAWHEEPARRIIGERFVEEGGLLSPGDPIVTVLDIDVLEAAVFVIERDYARVQPGQPAEIHTDAYPGEVFAGEVQRVAPLLAEASRQARVEVRVANADRRLRPGMFARVRLEFDQRERATVVPREALVQRGGRDAVLLVDREAGACTLVPVEVGIVARDRVEIRSPALSGEVVTVGHHLLGDGGPITVVERDDAPEGGTS